MRELNQIVGENPFQDRPPIKTPEYLERLADFSTILEIGPFDKPTANRTTAPNARIQYCDFLSTEELRERAAQIPGRNPASVPQIDYVTKNGLGDIHAKFDCVVSSHTIEHVPDLIQHLNDVRGMLNANGSYVMIVPDKRHCFDHYLPESGFPEIIAAHLEQRSRPTMRSVIEHRAFTRHDYPTSDDPWTRPTPETRRIAEDAAREFAGQPYVDVHCWQFTPASFYNVVQGLARMDYIEPPKIDCRTLGGEFGVELRWA